MRDLVRKVISASRRTDIPAFYMTWFMEQIRVGRFEIINPYNRRRSILPATPDTIHTIVFWSKNFESFITRDDGRQLQREGYHLFFNFTINSEDRVLEPHVPPLNRRLRQLAQLCAQFGPECINWRFDPMCFYRLNRNRRDNLHDFDKIVEQAASLGIRRCITSFMDNYAKIQKRIIAHTGFSFVDPSIAEKRSLVLKMERRLSPKNIKLEICCEKKLVAMLPESSNITGSTCIPNRRLQDLYGGRLSVKKDSGQRVSAGCGCGSSTDIGSYQRHPCFHNCLFCYANPSPPKPTKLKQ